MAYNLQMVKLSVSPLNNLTASGRLGFPTTFNFLLFSAWVCLGPSPMAHRIVSFSDAIPFFSFGLINTQISVALNRKQSVSALSATFAAGIGTIRSNVLISVDLPSDVIQVYVNDQPVTGSLSWSGSGGFNLGGGLNNWNITPAGSVSPGSGVADLYLINPASFYDLSVTGNRRAFINANLTPVDLTANGSGPTGTQPEIFLTVRGASPASAFATNNGFGGSFTVTGPALTFQAAGSCAILGIGTPQSAIIGKRLTP